MPVYIVLVDASHTFDSPQHQVLALARSLAGDSRVRVRICCVQASPLAVAAKDCGLAVTLLPARSAAGLRALWRVWCIQRRDTPLLLHSFCAQSLLLCARLARLRSKVPTVRIHSIFGRTPSVAGQEHTLWQGLDRIICPSARVREDLARMGLSAARLALVHPGLHVESAPARAERSRTADRFVFAALAPLEAASGLDVLIRAMSALWQREDLGQWEVRIAGSGPHFAALLDEAKTLGVDTRLALLGTQLPQDVLPWADAVLAPTVDSYGTISALEWAWAMRLPLVCSNVPVHAELARNTINALLVAPGDPQELAAAMICCIRLASVREHMHTAGANMHTYIAQERVLYQIRSAYAQSLPQLPPVLQCASAQALSPTTFIANAP